MKRAQLLAADLALAFNRNGAGLFSDMHRLTIFADNPTLHVLRMDGILEYELLLAQRIDNDVLITPVSEEEIEIRVCALHGVELMVSAHSQVHQSLQRRNWSIYYGTVDKSRTINAPNLTTGNSLEHLQITQGIAWQ